MNKTQTIDVINFLVDKYDGEIICKGRGSNNIRAKVNESILKEIAWSVSRSNASYIVYYGSNKNAYSKYISNDLAFYIKENLDKASKIVFPND